MATRKKILQGYAGRRDIRPSVTAADAADWVPEDETDERLYYINAQAWEDLRISIQEDGDEPGGVGAGTRVCFQLLMGVHDRDDGELANCGVGEGPGRHWIPFTECCFDADCQTELFVVDGHDISVRFTQVITTKTNASIRIFATGGTRLTER